MRRPRARAIAISVNNLLDIVRSLKDNELDTFADKVLQLRAGRRARILPERETALLQQINQPIPAGAFNRIKDLEQIRGERDLTEAENEEYRAVAEELEAYNAQRMQYLVELADLRQTTLAKVMKSLGIKPCLTHERIAGSTTLPGLPT